MDAARQRWLEAHPYLEPVARVDERLEAALDATAAPSLPEPDWQAYLADFQEGVPLLRSAAAKLDAAAAVAPLLGAAVSCLAAADVPEKLREDCRALSAAFEADPQACPRATRWALSGGAEGAPPERPGLVQYLAWRAAARALAPLVAAFAEWRDEGNWGHGHCPTCGALPVTAWLTPGDDVRERRLACGCCGTRWAFQRVGCAFCGNADPAHLSILVPEGEGGVRLDLCDGCKGYLKTFAGEGDPSLLLADWTTLHLDVLARERGYQRKGSSLYEL
ncbi:MAG TPA: formate dehydrogenase accessory protein FdhE [Anaeromyxobacteraceae bacterium]|jgi:FdhE protein|nr:formate dehydrogenase accessory protein FdhE [Anaeromyxobacteraceae bacterium]